jgi:CDP-diacylglycerol--glycerol-3-phosphate 3-phosphatidyltransferase
MNKRELINLPNFLSVLRICLTPLFVWLLFAEVWYWKSLAFVVFGVAALTDFYDGRLARAGNKVTAFGRFLDPLADKILVTAALVAFVWGRMVHFWLVVPIIVRDIVITGLRLYSIYHGRQLATSKLAKWKTAAQLFTVVVILFIIVLQEFVGHFNWDDVIPLDGVRIQIISNGLMAAVLLLTVLSGIHYLFRSSYFYNKS